MGDDTEELSLFDRRKIWSSKVEHRWKSTSQGKVIGNVISNSQEKVLGK